MLINNKQSYSFPSLLNIGKLDHYTLIVENAEKTANFYQKVLGFKFVEQRNINTGSCPRKKFDMVNFILISPGGKKCVVTQGVTSNSIFSRLLEKYGPGVHHIAYATKQIEEDFKKLKANKIKTTSNKIITDNINGLKQFFISREYAGHFIEIIDRPKVEKKYFTTPNMGQLAATMETYFE